MKRKCLFLLLCCSIAFSVVAQDKKDKSFRFHSINSLGIINGDGASSAALQSVNGFMRRHWFAGIGVGIDYYRYCTIPLFADIRYELGKKKNKLFAYADGGINLEWAEEFTSDGFWWWDTRSNEFSNGFYHDAGVGLNIGMKNKNAFLLSVGYSRKTMKEKISYQDWRTLEMETSVNTYRLNRIMIKLGFRF